jgi:porin
VSRALKLIAAALAAAAIGGDTGWAAGGGPPGLLFNETEIPAEAPKLPEDFWSRQNLLGDLGGLRPWMERYGLSFSATETSEVLGNPTGGIRQGAIYEGVTDLNLGFDLRTYFGWRGAFFVRAYQIHGRGLSANDLDNLNTASGVEADRTTRLFELWYEQRFGDWLRIRIGEQSAGQEFMVSSTGRMFVNGTFGWPTPPSLDLPSGGPGYPLSAPAVRFRVDANDQLTFFAGLFDGNPAGPGFGDPQQRDLSGTAFRLNDGALAIAEVRYNPGNTPSNGTYRFGAWYDSKNFPSQQFDTPGVPLAIPLLTQMPQLLGSDYSIYGIVDQPLFHMKDSDAGLTAFTRAMGAPGDRNLIDFYLDGGFTYKGPFDRKDDIVGAAFAFARIGSAARALDAEKAGLTTLPYPVRTGETIFELTYRIQLAPWWQVQPDFQYVINPSGGILNPNVPGQRVGNAAVLGIRTAITF